MDGPSIFHGPVIDWTQDQKDFIYWCSYYNKHYFSLDSDERCHDRIFKYNPLFDRYVKDKEFREKNPPKDKANKSPGSSTYTWNFV